LLAAAQHREELRQDDVQSAFAFALEFPDYLVYHNMRHTGATQPAHLHFQAVLRDEPLPIEAAPRKVWCSLDGAVVAWVEDYPAYSLAITGEQAPDVACAVLQALRPSPFNLVMSKGEIVIVPRTVEQPSGFASKFGALEMAGWTVFVEEQAYQRLQYDEIQHAIAECGLCWTKQHALEERLKGFFALSYP